MCKVEIYKLSSKSYQQMALGDVSLPKLGALGTYNVTNQQ